MGCDVMSRKKPSPGQPVEPSRLDQAVIKARQDADARLKGYRQQSLGIHPWVCARCGREFTRKNLHELTVHHKDHNHDNNPADGSNWENLCLYCHDNEHQRFVDRVTGHDGLAPAEPEVTTYKPFADLAAKMGNKNKGEDES
ncbi:MAG: YajD family HNH nuclease [Gammaproteobacteria bacterium]|nr:MAG: YajD family HNH nuclease [Gammaproteobacteria bacterium]